MTLLNGSCAAKLSRPISRGTEQQFRDFDMQAQPCVLTALLPRPSTCPTTASLPQSTQQKPDPLRSSSLRFRTYASAQAQTAQHKHRHQLCASFTVSFLLKCTLTYVYINLHIRYMGAV